MSKLIKVITCKEDGTLIDTLFTTAESSEITRKLEYSFECFDTQEEYEEFLEEQSDELDIEEEEDDDDLDEEDEE